MNRYAGRRFLGFLITSGLLYAGLIYGDPSIYSAFSAAIGVSYAAYLGGQSATDWKNAGVQR